MTSNHGTPNDPNRRGALVRLGLLGAGAAAAAAGCSKGWSPPQDDPFSRALAKPYVRGAEKYGSREERWVSTSCAQCPAGCGIRVRVVEGRAVRVEGHPDNPINRGGVGPRGLSSLQALYDPDRLDGPLIRDNGKLIPVEWDSAIDLLAHRLRTLRSGGTPEKLLVWSGRERGVMNELLERFALAFGTPNFVDGRPGHAAAMTQAMDLALGSYESPAYEWAGAQMVLSLEAGLFEDSCQAVYLTRVASQLRRRNGHRTRIVHVGPTFDLCAYDADDWIRVHPGTSGALALGVGYLLLKELAYDMLFAQERSDGFEDFRSFIDEYTPAHVHEVTGATTRQIERLAADMAERRPSFAFVDDRSLAYTNGLDTALAALSLNALLGGVETAAAGVRIAPEAPLRPWPGAELDSIAHAGLSSPRLDAAGTIAFPRARTVHETLPDSLADVEVALLYHVNPVYARPQPKRWRAAFEKVPFVVSFSPYHDETVDQVADLVLPDHTFLERWEDAAAAPMPPRAVVGVRHPAVDPVLNTRTTGDVIIDVAQRVGGSVERSFAWTSFRRAVEQRLLGLHDAKRGSVRAPTEAEFLQQLYDHGVWYESTPQPPQVNRRFKFPAKWDAPQWDGDPQQYPIQLVAYRPLGYAEGSGANLPWLRHLRGRPGTGAWKSTATMHPDTATVGENDIVRVESAHGAIDIPVHLDDRIDQGVVAVPMGAGHTAFGRWAKGFGANVMDVLRPGAAPDTGAGVLCGTRVRVTRAGGKS